MLSGCVLPIVAVAPLTITVVYLDAKATKGGAGPQVSVTGEPWRGVLNTMPISMKQP